MNNTHSKRFFQGCLALSALIVGVGSYSRLAQATTSSGGLENTISPMIGFPYHRDASTAACFIATSPSVLKNYCNDNEIWEVPIPHKVNNYCPGGSALNSPPCTGLSPYTESQTVTLAGTGSPSARLYSYRPDGTIIGYTGTTTIGTGSTTGTPATQLTLSGVNYPAVLMVEFVLPPLTSVHFVGY